MLLLLDNYDSFTYNLLQYFQILGQSVTVYKNDEITISEVASLNPTQIVISPGPNSPNEAGISLALIEAFYQLKPILGICLGHQCIGQFFGGKIIRAPEIMHGKTSKILHHYQKLFKDIPNDFEATRYHSLIVEANSLPDCLNIDAMTGETMMALSHRDYPVYGIQFHPESILSEHGLTLLKNFVNIEKG